ncbi:phage tail protein, partial [Pseudomonas japonica]
MPWYRAGTVTATAGQTTITGAGTSFAANARVGDALQGPDGRWYEVTNIASATVMSILPAYQGATVAGGSYGLAPMQG